jgi:hypothetical protein
VRVLVVALPLMLLGACVGRPNGPVETGIYVAAAKPTGADLVGPPPADYRIGPLDQIRIDVFQEPELSLQNLPVDTNGNINMPLAGSIKAQGLTANELSDSIARDLVRYLKSPHVTVNVTKFTSQRVTVGGSVQRPGVFEETGRLTLMNALALAGGLSDYGRSTAGNSPALISKRSRPVRRPIPTFRPAMLSWSASLLRGGSSGTPSASFPLLLVSLSPSSMVSADHGLS